VDFRGKRATKSTDFYGDLGAASNSDAYWFRLEIEDVRVGLSHQQKKKGQRKRGRQRARARSAAAPVWPARLRACACAPGWLVRSVVFFFFWFFSSPSYFFSIICFTASI
jgi:hypothetical protein